MSLDQLDKINLELLLEHASQLPSAPRIFARLSKLVEDEDTSLEYISSLVKMDPGLSAQILRVTNSAYYGASIKVSDLDTAISRIGFSEVQKVLSMVITHDCFDQAVPAYGITAAAFADECVEVAVTSETLAKRVGLDPNVPYIAGLLHRIGKLAINLYLEKLNTMVDLSKHAIDRSIEDVEKEALGMTHWRVGAELLRHWQFENRIWHPIKNQLSPHNSASFEKETALLTLAIWITQVINEGHDPDSPLPIRTSWALKRLGIDPLDIATLSDDARFEISDRKNMLSLLL